MKSWETEIWFAKIHVAWQSIASCKCSILPASLQDLQWNSGAGTQGWVNHATNRNKPTPKMCINIVFFSQKADFTKTDFSMGRLSVLTIRLTSWYLLYSWK